MIILEERGRSIRGPAILWNGGVGSVLGKTPMEDDGLPTEDLEAVSKQIIKVCAPRAREMFVKESGVV